MSDEYLVKRQRLPRSYSSPLPKASSPWLTWPGVRPEPKEIGKGRDKGAIHFLNGGFRCMHGFCIAAPIRLPALRLPKQQFLI
jgi:hypothetical protein